MMSLYPVGNESAPASVMVIEGEDEWINLSKIRADAGTECQDG